MITRRRFFTGIAASTLIPAIGPTGALAASSPQRGDSRLDKLVPIIDPVIDLFNPHTDERINVRFFTATGYSSDALRQINWLLRDWRQKEAVQINARLLWGLAALRQAGLKEGNSGLINANSGYRTEKTNSLLRSQGYRTAKNSFHLRGEAIDFTMPGAKVSHLAKYAKWLEIGGTGHYRNSFVHIDSGQKREWLG